MFTNLFLETTNPHLSWKNFFSKSILIMIIFSVIFHTFSYTFLINIINYIFTGKILNKKINSRLIIFFICIMFLGYIGRFIHVKEIYNAMNKNDLNTYEYINTHYNSWVFVG